MQLVLTEPQFTYLNVSGEMLEYVVEGNVERGVRRDFAGTDYHVGMEPNAKFSI